MATRTSNTKTASTSNRRTGRPTNAERNARVQSQQSLLIDVAVAAASAALKAAMGIADGGVTSIGIPQASQSQTATNATASTGQSASKTTTRKAKQAPGRRVDENSKMSQTKEFYDQNLKAANPLARADFVRAAAAKFAYSKETANTYVSNIEKAGGYKMVRRGGTAARGGRSRGNASTAVAKTA